MLLFLKATLKRKIEIVVCYVLDVFKCVFHCCLLSFGCFQMCIQRFADISFFFLVTYCSFRFFHSLVVAREDIVKFYLVPWLQTDNFWKIIYDFAHTKTFVLPTFSICRINANIRLL